MRGVSTIIALDRVDTRLAVAHQLGTEVTLNFEQVDVVTEIMRPTGGRGMDASIEAPGLQPTVESTLRVLKPGGTLSSLDAYSSDLQIPLDAFNAALGDKKMVSSLHPGGKERMRQLMNIVESQRVDLAPLATPHYALHDIGATPDRRDRESQADRGCHPGPGSRWPAWPTA